MTWVGRAFVCFHVAVCPSEACRARAHVLVWSGAGTGGPCSAGLLMATHIQVHVTVFSEIALLTQTLIRNSAEAVFGSYTRNIVDQPWKTVQMTTDV